MLCHLTTFLVVVLGSSVAHGQVECSTSDGNKKVITAEKINDGYCDCPFTGVDEPGTSACAGSYAWSGLGAKDGDSPAANAPLMFSCPQQGKFKIPMSRVNDGLCDCCDGADESSSGVTCKNDCERFLAEQRRQRKELEDKFQKGSQIRQQMIDNFARHRKEKLQEVATLEKTMGQTEESLAKLKEQYNTLELEWIQKRFKTVDSKLQAIATTTKSSEATPAITGMLEGLSTEELTWWIIHACQISGEMMTEDGSFANDAPSGGRGGRNKNRGSSKTCIPLRLAGLDAQIMWESNSYEMTMVQDDDNDSAKKEILSILAQILDINLQSDGALVWNRHRLPARFSSSSRSSSRRRRLDDVDFDGDYDDYPMDDDETFDDLYDMEDEDNFGGEGQLEGTGNDVQNGGTDAEADTTDKREEIMSLLKTKAFSFPRLRYLEQSSSLLETIERLSNQDDEGDEAEQSPDIQFDPMALPMTKSKLQRRVEAIEHGFDFAISGKVLMGSFHAFEFKGNSDEKKMEALRRLALGVVNYGQLSTFHVWQLFRAVIPEIAGDTATTAPSGGEEEGSCVAPWASSCPPSSIKRISSSSGTEINVPSETIVEQAETDCDALMSQSISDQAMCTEPGIKDSIPSEIPDGYFGYYQVKPRSEHDLISKTFVGLGLEDDSEERNKLLGVQTEISDREDEKKGMKTSIDNALEMIGGRDEPDTLGVDGELFDLKDKCFTFDAPAYKYELCLFKTATQKDSGGGGGGVHLGNWVGQTIKESNEIVDGDEKTLRHRVWRWDGGAKCWNGPIRSATAIITCGKETKIISADEPETCSYVMEVECPIGCDDDFRALHKL